MQAQLYPKRASIKHISEVHEVKKPLKCGICDQSFSKMGNLTTHIASVHNGKTSFKCDICDQIFL